MGEAVGRLHDRRAIGDSLDRVPGVADAPPAPRFRPAAGELPCGAELALCRSKSPVHEHAGHASRLGRSPWPGRRVEERVVGDVGGVPSVRTERECLSKRGDRRRAAATRWCHRLHTHHSQVACSRTPGSPSSICWYDSTMSSLRNASGTASRRRADGGEHRASPSRKSARPRCGGDAGSSTPRRVGRAAVDAHLPRARRRSAEHQRLLDPQGAAGTAPCRPPSGRRVGLDRGRRVAGLRAAAAGASLIEQHRAQARVEQPPMPGRDLIWVRRRHAPGWFPVVRAARLRAGGSRCPRRRRACRCRRLDLGVEAGHQRDASASTARWRRGRSRRRRRGR